MLLCPQCLLLRKSLGFDAGAPLQQYETSCASGRPEGTGGFVAAATFQQMLEAIRRTTRS